MKKLFIILLASVSIQFSVFSQTRMLTGGSVTSIVDNLSKRVSKISSEQEPSMSKKMFNVQQNLSILSDQLDYIADKRIKKGFNNLNVAQKEQLTSIEATIISFEETGAVPLSKTREIIDRANIFAGSLPKGKKEPVITTVSKSYFREQSLTNVFTINGSYLAAGKPFIRVNNEDYFPLQKTDSELEFELPFDMWVDSSKLTNIKVELVLYNTTFSGQQEKKYQLLFFLIPEQFGTYKLYSKVIEDQKILKTRNLTFSYRNDHCQGDKWKTWTFNPQGGPWKIDVTTIDARASNVSAHSQFDGLRNLSPRGFQVVAKVVNSGDCNSTRKDTRGSVSGRVTWTEYRINEMSVNNGMIAEGTLFWDEDIVFDLPENLDAFTLEIDQMDGTHEVITGTELAAWFTVIYTQRPNRLVIKPAELEQALRNQ